LQLKLNKITLIIVARCIFEGDPDNGFAVRNALFNRTVKHGVQILYRCNEHYTLIGSATQECNNGQWTNARPSCKGTCGRPTIPSRGPLILFGNSFLDGDEVQFSCVANYDLFGSQRSRCNGQKWNTSTPECKGWYFSHISLLQVYLSARTVLWQLSSCCQKEMKKREWYL